MGLQFKPNPVDTALKGMAFIPYWKLGIHITAHETITFLI